MIFTECWVVSNFNEDSITTYYHQLLMWMVPWIENMAVIWLAMQSGL